MDDDVINSKLTDCEIDVVPEDHIVNFDPVMNLWKNSQLTDFSEVHITGTYNSTYSRI